MAENPYFSRIMNAVDTIVGENLHRKRLAEQEKLNLDMLRRKEAFQREMVDKRLEGQQNLQILRNTGNVAQIKAKNKVRNESLISLPPELENKYPALAGFGKIWKPSEVAMIINRSNQLSGLNNYRTGMLTEKKRHNVVMETKKGRSQGNIGSADPRKRLESLRKEAIDLLKSGYYGDYAKEPAGKDKVTAYVKRLDELLKKQRSGNLNIADKKEIDNIESFLVYSQKKDNRIQAGNEAINKLTNILGKLEKEL